MASGSRYDTIRKRVAPLAFLAALVFLGTRTCQSEMAKVELWFDVGSHTASLTSLQAEIARQSDPDEVLGVFEHNFKNAPSSIPARWKLQLDPGMYVVRITMTTDKGVVRDTRIAEAVDNAVIRIPLARVLSGDGD